MRPDEVAVVAAGLGAIAWVNWYFFLADRGGASARTAKGGVQEVTIAVHGGYDPATVRVKAGAPVRIVFDRQETSSCSEEIVIPDFGVRRFLPAFQKTVIDIPAGPAGSHEMSCGMGMLHGTIVVE
ncbi:MAG: hypothetical protein JWO05_1916 [Gemmatimonadetes bacterium]|nr:hypothetical protein [Gemmatimonadota bacterium]